MTHFNQLSAAEAERLAMLAEEAGEIVQVVGKILRHGFESTNPNGHTGETNREMLERELGDLAAVKKIMSQNRDVSLLKIDTFRQRKQSRIHKYTHHQES